MLLLIVCLLSAALAAGYDTPDDCDWTFVDDVEGYAGGISLTCHLNAINSDVEKTNFSVIPSELTRELTVVCNRDLGASRLEPSGFASLFNLRELTLRNCHLEHVPALAFNGLENLRRLSIFASPEAGRRLAIGIDAFLGLPRLQHLSMPSNGLRSIPRNELCRLPSLLSLDLKGNYVGSLDDLGFFGGCLPNLERLDVSGNRIASLKSSLLDDFPALQRLDVGDNRVRAVDQDLEYFKPEERTPLKLRHLNLANNAVAALPPALLRRCVALETFSAANNSISQLDPFLFDGLPSLAELDLSGNVLSAFDERLVRDLASLRSLNLDGNRIEALAPAAFPPGLEMLSLSGNRIGELLEGVFESMSKLKNLDVTENRLASLGRSSLAGLDSLTHLLLGRNDIRTVDAEALASCGGSLLVLDLGGNELESPPEALSSLSVLQTLDLSRNVISSVAGASFLKMRRLWRLQLNGNFLRNVTKGLFDELASLQILDLSENRIDLVEKGSLDSNRQLRAVRLDANAITSMDGVFERLDGLGWLNVSANAIEDFDYAFLPPNLKWLHLSRNRIPELKNSDDRQLQLETLDASFNLLKQLGPHNLPDSIETLLANDNAIWQVAPYTFFKKTSLVKVDLTVNELKTIDMNALRLSSDIRRLPDFFLTGNPIECDCEMVWLKTINSASASSSASSSSPSLQMYPLVRDIESIYCRLIHARGRPAFVPLVEASDDEFLCRYETHCFSLCQCCDFDACDCEMTCPDGCTCYRDSSWTKNVAECSSSGFRRLPKGLPMDATEVFLDGNFFPNLRSHTFIGRKNLRVLHLNDSRIRAIRNNTFNGLTSLTVLHLQRNRISSLQGHEFKALQQLRELNLEGNLISHIHADTFRSLPNLQVLRLDNNRVVDFPVWQLASNPVLAAVSLAENLWSCRCEFARRFGSWMAAHGSKVTDRQAVGCVSNEVLRNMGGLECEDDGSSSSSSSSSSAMSGIATDEDQLPLLAAALASFAVVLLVLLAVFVYRNTLRVWIHSKYGVRVLDVEPSDIDDGKLFDAFVSYSPKDDAFARELLAGELERDGYRTCLHHRDLPAATAAAATAGSRYVADAIVQATHASRRTVLILSENFLRSEWSRYDYKSGLHQAMRSGRRKLVVVMLGDVAGRDVDPDLRLYLKNSAVIRWGEKLFWQRLRYALPDVRQRSSSHSPNSTVVSSVSEGEHIYQSAVSVTDPLKLNNNAMVAGHGGGGGHVLVRMPSLPGQQVLPSYTYGRRGRGDAGPVTASVAAVHI